MNTLWPFQTESVEALRANIREGIKRQVLCSPTGSGKTEIAMEIVRSAADKGSRVYFICDRQTLVNQTSKRFYDNGIPHGIFMGDSSMRVWENVLVVSSQTLESRGFNWRLPGDMFNGGKPAEDPDLVIVDECHEIRKSVAEYLVLQDLTAIGLSATPFTLGLAKYYDAIVNVTTTNELLKDGYLAPLKVVAARSEIDVSGLSLNSRGEWVKAEVSDRLMAITGDVVPEWLRQTGEYFGEPVPTIAFCPTVVDSEELAEKFKQAGHDFRVVHYKQSADEKQDIIDAYKRDEFMGLISCVALTKGFDAPKTMCMIDCYPLRKSIKMHIQKVGRIMRTSEGKPFGLLIDHAGNWLGFYDKTHQFFDTGCHQLEDEKLENVTRKDAEETQHLRCKSCGAFMTPASRICPSCGAERKLPRGKLVTQYGELVEIDVVDGNGVSLPFKGDWWPEICAVACAMTPDPDKARKIALAKYRDIFGRWPGDDFQMMDRKPHPEVRKYTNKQYRDFINSRKRSRADAESNNVAGTLGA